MAPHRRTGVQIGIAAAALCGVAAVAVFTHWTRDKWVEVPLAALLSVCFAIPAAVVAAASVIARRGGRRAQWDAIRALCLAVLAFCASAWVGVPLRMGLAWYDQKKALEFCEFLLPAIERYRVDHAGYPDDVVWLVAEQGSGKIPKLIENGFQYHRRDGSFVMGFIAPDRPFAWHVFDSKRGTWSLETD